MKPDESCLDSLVAAVLASPKYRHIHPDLVRRIGEAELAKALLKDATKETKSRLHQAAGAYIGPVNYAKWSSELGAAEPEDLRSLSLRWMAAHASTRERIAVLDSFYSDVLASIAPVSSVIDIACGLNPLAVSWMGLAEGATYRAYDLYADMMQFVADYLQAAGVAGVAEARDCVGNPPEESAELALVLKFLPILEQSVKGGTLGWLMRLNAPHILVSFPTGSLGGRGRGMIHNYEARFQQAVEAGPWKIQRFAFATELCFLLSR